MKINDIYQNLGIRPSVLEFGSAIERNLKERFTAIDKTAEYNQLKVIGAMQDNRVNADCFHFASGYGYDDVGRDTLEAVYASVFHTESALVRPQVTCGTHALALALGANLRPGDELLSAGGKPYDTLEEVIGIRPSNGSLAEYGISYRQADLLPDGSFDFDGIKAAINERTKMVTVQRSKGYQTRPSFSVAQIGEVIRFVKEIKPEIICMVDNCYGEFVEETEPSDVGADMVVGSLIKNPGGGLAPIGGYIAGRKDLRGIPWNYFPRGRVEISHGRAFLYMNPEILNCNDYLERIREKFGIGHLDIRVRIDNSAHYQCTILEDMENDSERLSYLRQGKEKRRVSWTERS